MSRDFSKFLLSFGEFLGVFDLWGLGELGD